MQMSKIVNVEYLHLPVIEGRGFSDKRPDHVLACVLTQDDAGLFAAYMGLARNPECGLRDEDKKLIREMNADALARHGSKLRYSELSLFWRGVKEEEYRR
jgi:hypothetical protein